MASLTLTELSGFTYYIPSPSNVGLFIEGTKAILVDSGSDKEAGRQILKLIKEKDLEISLIINTHSNANQYVLIFSTIRSILSYLLDEKLVGVSCNSGRMLWRRL